MVGRADLDILDMLTEDVLREAAGPDLVDQAYMDLANDHVVQRTHLPGDVISARWDYSPNSPMMSARGEGDDLFMLCSCRQFQREGTCQHITALLVAWATDRESFTIMGGEAPTSGEIPSAPAAKPKTPVSIPVFDVAGDYKRILAQFTVGELREIARRRNVQISGIRKDPIDETLAQALSQKDKLRQDWTQLSPQARLLAGLLPFIVTYMNTAALEQAVQSLGVKGEAFAQAVEDLRSFGLITVDNYGAISYPSILPFWSPPDSDFVQAPVLDVRSLRTQPAPDPRSFYRTITRLLVLLQAAAEAYPVRVDAPAKQSLKKAPMLREWPMEQRDAERVAQADKPYQLIQQEGVRIAPAPSILTNEARQKLAALAQASPEQLDFAVRLLQAFELIQVTPGKPIRPVEGAMALILQSEPLQFLRQMLAGYVGLESWTELDLAMPHPQSFRLILRNYNQGSYARFLANAGALREKMVLLLRRLYAGQWVSPADLARRASQLPILPLLRGLLEREHFEINQRRINLDRPADVQLLLSQFLECMLAGPLYWQGMVDLAWEKERLAGFRLTPLGAALLSQPVDFQMPESAESGRPLDFTPEGNLVLRLEAASGSLIGLSILLGTVDTGQEGTIIVRPNLAGAGRAFETGWSADRILATLAGEAGKPVPSALANLLNRWWQDFGSAQIYQDVALMEFGDDYALNELLAGTSLSRYLLYRFSPRLIAIRPEGAAELREELVKKGYTPKTAA